MALTYLKNEDIQYFEIWEKSPRLPSSVQKSLEGLSAEDKLIEAVEYYLLNEDVMNLSRSMSVLGWNPIEITNGINRNGSIVLFDGNRRLIAANLILNPNLVKDVKFMVSDDDEESIQAYELLKQYRDGMSEELLNTLRNVPVIEFNSAVYSLESASAEIMAESMKGAFSDDLECPECGRFEFADEETICPDCECDL